MIERVLGCATAAGLGLLVLAAPQAASAEAGTMGELEFRNNCAACHGPAGLGDGPVASVLSTPPKPLTTLARRNDGRFPTDRIIQIIDGRADVKAHGSRDMPVWGDRYSAEAQDIAAPGAQALARESYVRGRIAELVLFLQSIQSK